jgi:hypothetical protein
MKERVPSLQRAANDPRQHVGDHAVVCLVAGMKQTPNCRVANMMSSASREGISHQEFQLPSRGNRPLGKPVFVTAGADATGTEHHGPRAGTHLDFKLLTKTPKPVSF